MNLISLILGILGQGSPSSTYCSSTEVQSRVVQQRALTLPFVSHQGHKNVVVCAGILGVSSCHGDGVDFHLKSTGSRQRFMLARLKLFLGLLVTTPHFNVASAFLANSSDQTMCRYSRFTGEAFGTTPSAGGLLLVTLRSAVVTFSSSFEYSEDMEPLTCKRR